MKPDSAKATGRLPTLNRKPIVGVSFACAFIVGLLAFRALWFSMINSDPDLGIGGWILAIVLGPLSLAILGVAGYLMWARIIAPTSPADLERYDWSAGRVLWVFLGIFFGSVLSILVISGGL